LLAKTTRIYLACHERKGNCDCLAESLSGSSKNTTLQRYNWMQRWITFTQWQNITFNK